MHKGKEERGELIEKGFSEDPEADARLFAGGGVFTEEETIDAIKLRREDSKE